MYCMQRDPFHCPLHQIISQGAEVGNSWIPPFSGPPQLVLHFGYLSEFSLESWMLLASAFYKSIYDKAFPFWCTSNSHVDLLHVHLACMCILCICREAQCAQQNGRHARPFYVLIHTQINSLNCCLGLKLMWNCPWPWSGVRGFVFMDLPYTESNSHFPSPVFAWNLEFHFHCFAMQRVPPSQLLLWKRYSLGSCSGTILRRSRWQRSISSQWTAWEL